MRAAVIRSGLTLLVAGTLAAGVAGCGHGLRGSTGSAPTTPAAVIASATTVARTVAPARPTSSAAHPVTTSATVDLAAVQADLSTVDGAASQSDRDFSAGTSAQSQNDQP